MDRRVVALMMSLVLVGAACGADGTPFGADRPAGETQLEQIDPSDVDLAEARWAAQGPASYSYVIDGSCRCDLDGRFRVWVVDGTAVRTVPLDADAEVHRQRADRSITDLFSMFREALMARDDEGFHGAGVAAAFGPDGHPTGFAISWTAGDPSYEATIGELTPVDGEHAPPTSPEPNLFLVVTNQSYDDPQVRLGVSVGEQAIVDRVFEVGDQHQFIGYELAVPPGRHDVVVSSDAGGTLEQVVTVDPGRPRYVFIAHWGDDVTGSDADLELNVSDEPFMFG